MLIDTSTIVPARSTDFNENLLRDFLVIGCEWRGPYSWGPKEEFFKAFTAFCYERKTTPEDRGLVETRLRRLGHEVGCNGFRGIFVRMKTDKLQPAPAATVPQPTMSERLATQVTPDLINANSDPIKPDPLTEDQIREQIYHEQL
jgi:hypothetical protein